MQYEWDETKAALNRDKHGVDFLDAIAAVEDPMRVEDVEEQIDPGEERIDVIGMAYGNILFVVTTLRLAEADEEVCRIISARKATRHEQDRYYASDR